eukprot:1147065-Pelagomonas_calceolata.AAC.6
MVPVWITNHGQGLAVDVLYIHEKPMAGLNCPQEVCFLSAELLSCLKIYGHPVQCIPIPANHLQSCALFALGKKHMLHPRIPEFVPMEAVHNSLHTGPDEQKSRSHRIHLRVFDQQYKEATQLNGACSLDE